jgi:hypothetical protein
MASDPAAMARLAVLLEAACLDIAELMADAEESRAEMLERAMALREKLGRVSSMAGLGPLVDLRIERKVRKVS